MPLINCRIKTWYYWCVWQKLFCIEDLINTWASSTIAVIKSFCTNANKRHETMWRVLNRGTVPQLSFNFFVIDCRFHQFLLDFILFIACRILNTINLKKSYLIIKLKYKTYCVIVHKFIKILNKINSWKKFDLKGLLEPEWNKHRNMSSDNKIHHKDNVNTINYTAVRP